MLEAVFVSQPTVWVHVPLSVLAGKKIRVSPRVVPSCNPRSKAGSGFPSCLCIENACRYEIRILSRTTDVSNFQPDLARPNGSWQGREFQYRDARAAREILMLSRFWGRSMETNRVFNFSYFRDRAVSYFGRTYLGHRP